jgi:hypothetical protein
VDRRTVREPKHHPFAGNTLAIPAFQVLPDTASGRFATYQQDLLCRRGSDAGHVMNPFGDASPGSAGRSRVIPATLQ